MSQRQETIYHRDVPSLEVLECRPHPGMNDRNRYLYHLLRQKHSHDHLFIHTEYA